LLRKVTAGFSEPELALPDRRPSHSDKEIL
jgi:hypothetical protein